MTSFQSRSVRFDAPQRISVRKETLPPLSSAQVCVETLYSAISSGTEMLIYRGLFPGNLKLDETISSLDGKFSYPLKYGYAVVGRVIEIGSDVPSEWKNRLVFAFHPHESHFYALPDELLPVPEDVSPVDAVFLPNMETAVNVVLDSAPLIGERVAVFGQGVVGLLITALLAYFPLASLVTVDLFETRRSISLQMGAHISFSDTAQITKQEQMRWLPNGTDLTIEVSGAPNALDQAIALTGFGGRVVVASWYGTKPVQLDLGGHFHRSRLKIISSQVSTIAAELSDRWDKRRRFDLVWEMLKRVHPSRLISHRFPVEQAEQAYRLIDQAGEQVLQVLFTYT